MDFLDFSAFASIPPFYSYGGSVVIGILLLVSYWIIFEKAGQPGWGAIIPIYNILLTLRVANKPWWWILLFLIPGANVVFIIWMFNRISLSFGQEAWFTVGLVLLPYIFLPILAFSKKMTWTKLPE